MAVLIRSIQDAGAAGDGSIDDYKALQNALDIIEAEKGGTLILEEPKIEYKVQRGLELPKVPLSIIGRGFHTALVGRGLSENTPVLGWKNLPGHVDHDFLLTNLKIRRNNSGPVVKYKPLDKGQRFKGRISNVELVQPGNGSGTLLYLERALNCHIDSVVLRGGKNGLGFFLTGSNAYVAHVVIMNKVDAPDGVHVKGGGQHHFSKIRTEGASHNFSFKFEGVTGSIFESLKTEGVYERRVFHVQNCEDLIFLSPGIAPPEKATDPDGMVFENSKRCQVKTARTKAMKDHGSGHAFVFDEYCEDISVEAYVAQGNALNEVNDQGGSNIRYLIIDSTGRRNNSHP